MLRRLIVLCGLAISLTACMSGGTKVTASDLVGFQNGVTTEREVISRLGKPDTVTVSSSGERIDVYAYSKTTPTAATFVPIVGIAAGGANNHVTAVTFRFDPKGLLIDYTSTESNTDVRTGLLNQ